MSGRTDTEQQEKLNPFYTLGIDDVVRCSEYPGKLGEVYYEDFESGCNVIGVFYPHTQERIDVTFKDWVEKEYTVASETEKRWFHRTDTDRLEWLISHPHCTVRGNPRTSFWSVMDAYDGLVFLSRNEPTARQAIDVAMDKDEQK